MIDRVVDKRFVLAQAEAVLQQLETRSAGLTTEEAEGAQHGELTAALREALRDESPGLSQRGFAGFAEMETTAEERKAFIPSNRVLSMVQTAIEEHLREAHAELLQPSPQSTGPGGPAVTARYTGIDDLLRDAKFAAHIAWALAKRWWRGSHGFVAATPPPTVDLAADARIVLVGDWGMGNANARKVASLIEDELTQAGSRHAHVIHLGDVYYSGEKSEAQKHVLDVWPVKAGDTDRWSWALNGNHDMYSGGFGYFDTLLQDVRFAAQRTAAGAGISYFMLQNEHWQFLGLDSAWQVHGFGLDGYLNDAQEQWAASCVQPADGPRTVLLTHHQYRSEHKQVGGDLATRLRPLLDGARGVDAWFWGHEHICAKLPLPDKKARYAACVGHGAIPHPVDNVTQPAGGWEYDQGYPDSDGDQWRWCGYAVLDLNDDKIDLRYVDEQGNDHHGQRLPV